MRYWLMVQIVYFDSDILEVQVPRGLSARGITGNCSDFEMSQGGVLLLLNFAVDP